MACKWIETVELAVGTICNYSPGRLHTWHAELSTWESLLPPTCSVASVTTIPFSWRPTARWPSPPLLHEHLGPPLQHGDLSTLHGNGFQALKWKNVNFVKHEIMTFYFCTEMVLFSGGSRRAMDAFALSPFIPPATKLRQGNVFTLVCDYIHRGEGEDLWPGGVSVRHAGSTHSTAMYSCFIFMQFSAKIMQYHRLVPPPHWGWHPLLGKHSSRMHTARFSTSSGETTPPPPPRCRLHEYMNHPLRCRPPPP